MENLARVRKQEFEPDIEKQAPPPTKHLEAANDREPVANDNEKIATPITHPEAASDNETAQPISTIYPEVANNNTPVITPEDAAQIQMFKERLGMQTAQGEEQPLPEQLVEVPPIPNPENIPVAAEAQPGSSEAGPGEKAPETAGASAGTEREDGGGTSGGGRRTPDLRVVEGTPKKKRKFGWVGKLLAAPFRFILWAGAMTTLLFVSSLRKLSNSGLKAVGYPDKGKGGGAKP